MNLYCHMASEFFKTRFGSVQATDNRINPQRILIVFINAAVYRCLSGNFRENVESVVDIVLQSFCIVQKFFAAYNYASGDLCTWQIETFSQECLCQICFYGF